MADTLRFNYFYRAGDLLQSMQVVEKRMARAATGTMKEVADLAKNAGRAAIASGGFGKKWQNALRSKVFPEKGDSLRPSAVISHKIPYSMVFETGATISGKPLLWLPLDSAPLARGGRRMSPREFTKNVGVLYSINRAGHRPLLAAVIRATDARAAKGVSLSLLRKGRNPKGRGTVRLVPIFVGVPSVTDPKKFSVIPAIKTAAARIPEIYQKHIANGR